MALPPGISFTPMTQADQAGNNPYANQPSTPIQDAIKVLNLRMPTQVGAQGLAPSQLLNSQGSGGIDPSLMALLQHLLGQGFHQPSGQVPGQDPNAPPAGPPNTGTAVPRVRPTTPPTPPSGGFPPPNPSRMPGPSNPPIQGGVRTQPAPPIKRQ